MIDPYEERANAAHDEWAEETRQQKLRDQIEALPTHAISGYEWECDECDFWFATDERWRDTPTDERTESYHDSEGNTCDHQELIDRRLVLALLTP